RPVGVYRLFPAAGADDRADRHCPCIRDGRRAGPRDPGRVALGRSRQAPSTMKARPFELVSRSGNIFWYSGELYQRLIAAASANSRMTMRFGSGPPSTSPVAPPLARN